MRILIADDDLFSRKLLKDALRRLGHDVLEVDDGQKAWIHWQKEHVPLLISDWVMPEMDGLTLSRNIRATSQCRYTYIIMLTAMEGKQNYLEGMAAGADDFLTKPFDRDQLAARLRVAERILDLMDENRRLAKLIPVCSYCRRARDDKDYWESLDQFLLKQTEAQVSHGICPDCLRDHFPDIYEDMLRSGEIK
jgi:DNA-binding response OmpR family regulator